MITTQRQKELEKLLNSLGLTCNDFDIIDRSLTHSSYTFENKLPPLENNERLEFLGDAVLKLIASDYLLNRFPDYTEGELTKIRAILVSDNILAKIAGEINLGKYLKIGYHEEKMGGRTRPSNTACAFEALLGALYLDGQTIGLRQALTDLFEEEVTTIDECAAKSNYKAILQEYTQSKGLELPVYNIAEELGPAHDKVFTIEAIIDNRVCGVGVGKSKKEAQQKAAQEAVYGLGIFNENEKQS